MEKFNNPVSLTVKFYCDDEYDHEITFDALYIATIVIRNQINEDGWSVIDRKTDDNKPGPDPIPKTADDIPYAATGAAIGTMVVAAKKAFKSTANKKNKQNDLIILFFYVNYLIYI